MNILNLHAGIGGNRAEWGDDVKVTAVEFDQSIADVYQKRFPNDKVIVCDAVEFLLDNYLNYDFIWASPPCQTHSTIINSQYTRDSYNAKLPDMSLYQIILFLKGHGRKCKWVVENVKPYYKPLIKPSVIIDRHLYWSNFQIESIDIEKKYIIKYVKVEDAPVDMTGIKEKRQVIRNQVDSRIGKHILNTAMEGQL